jgi:hypothetical protein
MKTSPNAFVFPQTEIKVLNSVLEVLTFSPCAEIENSLPPQKKKKKKFRHRKVNLFEESEVWHNFFSSLNSIIYVGTTSFKVLKNGHFYPESFVCVQNTSPLPESLLVEWAS